MALALMTLSAKIPSKFFKKAIILELGMVDWTLVTMSPSSIDSNILKYLIE